MSKKEELKKYKSKYEVINGIEDEQKRQRRRKITETEAEKTDFSKSYQKKKKKTFERKSSKTFEMERSFKKRKAKELLVICLESPSHP